jgi:hypothetical protein
MDYLFNGRGWPSKRENAKKRHPRVQIGMIACATRPQLFILETFSIEVPIDRSHPYEELVKFPRIAIRFY